MGQTVRRWFAAAWMSKAIAAATHELGAERLILTLPLTLFFDLDFDHFRQMQMQEKMGGTTTPPIV